MISPLDWGLGHATRCIPLIHLLLKQENEVFVCAEGSVEKLIRAEFPDINIIPFKGYGIKYAAHKKWFMWAIVLQLPKIAWRAMQERKSLNDIVAGIHPDLIISDNRLGFRHQHVKSVFITHQLSVKTGRKYLDTIARFFNYRYIQHFDECWVPDHEGADGLAGELSHPVKMPQMPVFYIGPLSRLSKISTTKKYHAAVIISGPEPQRSIFEKIILSQLKSIQQKIILVRGLPGEHNQIHQDQVIIYNHLPAGELSRLMQESNIVIARSGYSTIMDLVALDQKAVLVPTPGQTEQEYLADYLSKKGLFKAVCQEHFNLNQILEEMVQ